MQRCYIAIDLKSFYASVECVSRGLDPLDTMLVVADAERTDKTICLAVSPPLKTLGTGGRPRLFEVRECVRRANTRRGRSGSSFSARVLNSDRNVAVEFITAPPRMTRYMECSTRIYSIYLRYIAPEDIHVYSVDEVFIDATPYIRLYGMTAHELSMKLIREVLTETGITATAGIGSNMYLCKVAMDIVAKKMAPDADGVRIAELDEMGYRRLLWAHRPMTDFWRVGHGTASRLERLGLFTMGDVARCSLTNEGILYREFGVNAELLIDHAWGWEPVTMADVKAYRPATHSMSSGQVLAEPYTVSRARTVLMEMVEKVASDLVDERLVTKQIVVQVSYDTASLSSAGGAAYNGRVVTDHYGRAVPCHSHGTANLETLTSSARLLTAAALSIYARVVNPSLYVRRLTVCVNNLQPESAGQRKSAVQLNLFDFDDDAQRRLESEQRLQRERRLQEVTNTIRRHHGKNSLLKGLNYSDGATQRQRNQQIGGHHE